MPKTIHSKREDLICGKIDLAQEIAVKLNHIELLELLDSIRYDAVRMEQKLIIRKQEAKIKMKEAFVDGYEQGFERGQTGLGMFNLAQDKANEYCHTQAGRV